MQPTSIEATRWNWSGMWYNKEQWPRHAPAHYEHGKPCLQGDDMVTWIPSTWNMYGRVRDMMLKVTGPSWGLRFSSCTELHIAGGDSALGMVWHPLPAGPSLASPLQPHWCLRCLGLGCVKQLLWQLAVCGRSSVEPCYPILAVLTCSYCSSIRSPEAVPELPPPLLSLAQLMARGPPSFCLSTIHGDYDYFGLMHHIPNS